MRAEGNLTTEELTLLVDRVAAMSPPVDDADRIERVRQFERLKAVATAEQMVTAVELVDARRMDDAIAGVPAQRQGAGAPSEIALARRVSPATARRWIGLARILSTELPATYAALREGRTSEWRAQLVARETIFLSREDREQVDREVAPRLESMSDRQVETEARRAAYRLDPAGAAERVRHARNDRRVGTRPAADAMCWLTALLPVEQAVAGYAHLRRHADTLIGIGEQGTNPDGSLRSRGQIMADTLVERLTGQARADDVPVEINLVMTDRSLLHHDEEPALVLGHGAIPAPTARELALGPADRWIRRLYLTPDRSQLAEMDSRRRYFSDNQRHFVRVRDHDTCRTPWCGAPIRHVDHVEDWARTGRTRVAAGQGTCESCNYTKQAPGWRTSTDADGAVVTTTPTGHRYRSRAPSTVGARAGHSPDAQIPMIVIPAPGRSRSPAERRLRHRIIEYVVAQASSPFAKPFHEFGPSTSSTGPV